MRVVIQRVEEASVSIDGRIHSKIGKGLLILLGISAEDNNVDVVTICKKIGGMRIFPDENGKMNLDISSIDGEILVISQFTLLALVKKGNRPSFIKAAKPDLAIPLYELFVAEMNKYVRTVQTGIFGANMMVSLKNDGPVTIHMDSKNLE